LGVVALWGRIEAHATGMRAEHAAIRALGVVPGLGRVYARGMEAIASRLGVQLVDEAALTRAALEHGAPLPRALLP